MLIWTVNDVITAVLVGIMVIILIIFFVMVAIARLIEWFSRWRPYNRNKDEGDSE